MPSRKPIVLVVPWAIIALFSAFSLGRWVGAPRTPSPMIEPAQAAVTTVSPVVPAGAGSGTPKLVVPEPIFEFGERERGETVQHQFVLINQGEAPLVIQKISPACGCTVARLPNQRIEPGAKALLSTELRLHLQDGVQNREIVLETNDPLHKQVRLALRGTATSRVALEPKAVNFGIVDGTDPVEQVVHLKMLKGLKFNLEGTRTSHPQVTVVVEPVPTDHEWLVRIRLDPAAITTRYQGWVHVLTDHEGEYRTIGIPVRAQSGSPPPTAAAESSMIGVNVPLDGLTLSGQEYRIAEHQGKVVVVAFWASWCPACKRHLPEVAQLVKSYTDRPVEFVGVNVDANEAVAKKAAETLNYSWENVFWPTKPGDATPSLSVRYGVRQLPTIWVIDESGAVAAVTGPGTRLKFILDQLLLAAPKTESL